jgi:hypothetical protein
MKGNKPLEAARPNSYFTLIGNIDIRLSSPFALDASSLRLGTDIRSGGAGQGHELTEFVLFLHAAEFVSDTEQIFGVHFDLHIPWRNIGSRLAE